MYLDNSLVQESAVELIRVVGLVMSILMLSLSNFLRAVWQADSINGRNSIFKFNLITSYRDDYSKSRRQLMKQNHVDVAVTFYKENRRMTKVELEQLKKSNPSKAELDKIHVKLEQTN